MPQVLPVSTVPSSTLEEVKTNKPPNALFKCQDKYQNGTIESRKIMNDISNGGGNHNNSNLSNTNSNNTIVGGLLSLANTASNTCQVVAPNEKSSLSEQSQEGKNTATVAQSDKKNSLKERPDNSNPNVENRETNPSPAEGTTFNSHSNMKSSLSTSEARDGISNDGNSSMDSKVIEGQSLSNVSNGQTQKNATCPKSSTLGQETSSKQVVQTQHPQPRLQSLPHDQYHQSHSIKNQYIAQQHVPSHVNHYHQNAVMNSMSMHGHTPSMPPPHSQSVPYPNQNQPLPPQSTGISSPPRYQHRLHHQNHLHNKPHILHPGQAGAHTIYPNYPPQMARNVYQQVQHVQPKPQAAHPISQSSSPKESVYKADQQQKSQLLPRSPQSHNQIAYHHSRVPITNIPVSSTEHCPTHSTSSAEHVEETYKSKRSVPSSANSSSVERTISPSKTSSIVSSSNISSSPSKLTSPSLKNQESTIVESKPKLNPNKKKKLNSPSISNPITPLSSRVSNPNGYMHGPYYPDSSKKPYPPSQNFSSPGQYPYQAIPIYANNHNPVYQQHAPATPKHSGVPFHYHHPGHGTGTSNVPSHHYGTANNELYKHANCTHPNVNYNQWHGYPTPPNHGQPNGLVPPLPHEHGPGHSVIVTPTHHVRSRHPYQPQTPFTQVQKNGRNNDCKDAVKEYNLTPQQHLMPPPHPFHGEITSVAQWQQAQMITGFAPSANKCVPLKSPIPSKFWG